MNQIRNRDFFSFFSVHPALPAKSAFSKIAGFFYQNFFSLHSLSLCSRSLQKEPTGENSAIFEQFSSPPRRPLWKKERPFPLPIVPRAIIASFFFTGIPSRNFCGGQRNNFFFSRKLSLCKVFDQVLHYFIIE